MEETKNQPPDTMVALTMEQLNEMVDRAAKIGADAAISTFAEERKKDINRRKDKRLRNTNLLLRNYRALKAHAENSVFGRMQMEESAMDILESMMSMYNDEVIIDSIKRTATRTAIIVSHIDVMLGLFEVYCEKSTNREVDMRRYEVIQKRYLDEEAVSVKDLAEMYQTSKDTIYSDIRVAVERISALMFGVDGLNIQ